MISGVPQESNFAFNKVYKWLFIEQTCQLCDTPNDQAICIDCYKSFTYNIFACPHCAHPIETGNLCKVCISQAFYFDDAIVPFIYEFDIKPIIKQIKYHGDFNAVNQILAPLKQRITIKPNAIVYVPSHPSRQHQRGYNQAQILAQNLSDHFNIQILDHCYRIKPTPTLAQLTKKQRSKLLKGAFKCDQKMPEHVAIIDDILTTGATVNELAKVLRRKGAKRISVWAIARAVRD
ncbi:MAG: ComF family protein [Saccharospirillaceae bacterium]|nr:ComF family protein [Pseudomonadales bacterium]NRB79460.1 ComF family protein [Saccharospirillaceae bacterium]